MHNLCLGTGIHGIAPLISMRVDGRLNASQVIAVACDKSVTPPKKSASRFSFRYPLQPLWRGGGRNGRHYGIALDDFVLVENSENKCDAGDELEGRRMRSSNWVLKILQVKSLWKEEDVEEQRCSNFEESKQESESLEVNGTKKEEKEEDEDEEECGVCKLEEENGEEFEFDTESFSKLLRRVSLAEAKLYAQMSYLGNLAYCIPKIKPGNLMKYRGFRFVTSSIEKREMAIRAEKIQVSTEDQEAEKKIAREEAEVKKLKSSSSSRISASTAYEVAASAASYLHSQTKSILPFKSKTEGGRDPREEGNECNEDVPLMNSEMASVMVTTESVTAVVAAKEEVKQAVADGLSSTRSSPCEWFICDDDLGTRYFVIQGSESLASWQANLLFEPVQFEGLDVLVHRGIYEAAKGIYEQTLPEVHDHVNSQGRHATFRFTGHSLGGSLSLLLNLMFLIRGEVPASSLLPVITFGAPSIMCGGDHLLHKLGLPRNHIQAITMHRDIVPRAFSCNYPNHVAELLKAVNRNFRNYPCLNNQKLLYAPMGELLILQPDEKFSPQHNLLPSGSGLYLLCCPLSDRINAEKQLHAARTVFLNSPHPLEILSDCSAYGSEGTIVRDHDMKSYLKSVRNVIRQELNHIRKARRERPRKFWWSILTLGGIDDNVLAGERRTALLNMAQNQFNFSGVLQTGKESLKRLSRLVASQRMHLVVILLFPARLLLLGAFSVMCFR
ncbi:hypothetical protein K2173_000816 [Erythroxylum novogranatense]|uniref:Fungal lipase-type domain-containing protein n=1 Tax=Erythroxylum novogranatense TaxID=1862640 RepID=A0AAV8S855_9ROSI|nr:hypothetical protein K2173_000816 [Erythroxylum novogranatense]